MYDIFSHYGFELDPSELAQFEQFLTLFLEYNSHTNLSAIRDEEGIIEKHFVDSLFGGQVIQDFLSESSLGHTPKLLDIGSGGGFPGIPLHIVLPDIQTTLLDSVGKKTKAMQYFIEQMGLEGIESIQDRAENLAKNPHYQKQYDIIVSRATAYMTDILSWAEPFLAENGMILLYKMPSEDEYRDIRKITKKLGLLLTAEYPYTLGGKERVIYKFTRRK